MKTFATLSDFTESRRFFKSIPIGFKRFIKGKYSYKRASCHQKPYEWVYHSSFEKPIYMVWLQSAFGNPVTMAIGAVKKIGKVGGHFLEAIKITV
jgi:hypothetical protein